MTPAPHFVFAASAVFLLAGVVKGVVGLGLPTVAMALLALWMPPVEAAALLIVPSLVTNVWQMRPWSSCAGMLRRLGGMQLGVCAGTVGGAWWLGSPGGSSAEIALGIVLIAYAAWSLSGAKLSIPENSQAWWGLAVGAATGLVTAATGVFVVPAVPYLQALGLQRDELVQAMGISFTVSTLALAASLAAQGSYSGTGAASSLAMIVPALLGMALGQKLRSLLSPTRFRLCFLVSLALLGTHMAVRGLLPH